MPPEKDMHGRIPDRQPDRAGSEVRCRMQKNRGKSNRRTPDAIASVKREETGTMLDRQYHLYSVDTGDFYSNHERYLHNMNCRYRKERNYIQNKLHEIEKKAASENECQFWNKLIQHKQKKAKESKEQLLALLSDRVRQNELTGGRDHIRTLNKDALNDANVISVFDSALSRALGISQNELTDSLMIVQVYYFDVFKDLFFYGFVHKGEKYIYFTSSAGQIRSKKAVFMKETVWNRIKKTIMCGLSIEKINARGGNNVNKHLAYMALSNSATDEWKEFDIDKSIVIDDFETKVYGSFDFVDETDYSITRKTDAIPIPHTDGAGMILPSVSSRNFMFRAPWIKGLLGVFDFRKFVEVNGCSPVIRDIYGKAHDIIKEDIQIIFTKSQFKMYPYYDSWDEYKSFFKKYHCSAGKCNVEEERIKRAKINYQMLQTLTDITDAEIDLLTQKSAERISNICTSKEAMFDALGISPYNTDMTPFQQAVKLYPPLLGDTYTKDILREVKNSLLKKYRSGKLEVNGRYTFLLPDFYAACEYWFGHVETPTGLLADGEVFCRLFRRFDKLDCLRSPHLYREHAVRHNVAAETDTDRAKWIQEWFPTNGLYASTHDLISKILMYDVDGDKSLVVADQHLVEIAERNMRDIVPLYYNMRKAKPVLLNKPNIYAGLHAAFTGGNIGVYSNAISKIWNSEVFLSGSEEEKQDAIACIKQLCCQNNFVIDFAKTLYKPEFPKEVNDRITRFTGGKLPAFFAFAKDKEKSQIQERNGSFVNRLYDKIPDKPINTRSLRLGTLNYQKMMSDQNMRCSDEAAALYDTLNKQYRYMIHMKDARADNMAYIADKIRTSFSALGLSDETVTDMLVEYLYGRGKRYKQLLWFCYGEQVTANLKKNTEPPNTKYIACADCGEWIEIRARDNRTRRCPSCQKEHVRMCDRKRKQKDSV